jgi:hypothetical protein
MIERKPPELFAEPPVRSEYIRMPVRRPVMRRRLMLLALMVGVIGGFAAYWFFGSSGEEVPAEIPVIKAEGPVKQRPEKPGGIDIPHQNETVFQQIDTSTPKTTSAVEHLLPPPPVPQDVAATATPPAAPTVAPSPEAAPVAPVTPVVPQPKDGKLEKLEAPAELPLAAATPSAGSAEKKPEASAKPAAKSLETGSIPKEMFTGEAPAKGFFVQLGSFPDKKKADSEMARIKKKFAAALGKVNLEVSRADLQSKGTFYRIQGGPYSDPEARSICAALRSKKAPCIVVRP